MKVITSRTHSHRDTDNVIHGLHCVENITSLASHVNICCDLPQLCRPPSYTLIHSCNSVRLRGLRLFDGVLPGDAARFEVQFTSHVLPKWKYIKSKSFWHNGIKTVPKSLSLGAIKSIELSRMLVSESCLVVDFLRLENPSWLPFLSQYRTGIMLPSTPINLRVSFVREDWGVLSWH